MTDPVCTHKKTAIVRQIRSPLVELASNNRTTGALRETNEKTRSELNERWTKTNADEPGRIPEYESTAVLVASAVVHGKSSIWTGRNPLAGLIRLFSIFGRCSVRKETDSSIKKDGIFRRGASYVPDTFVVRQYARTDKDKRLASAGVRKQLAAEQVEKMNENVRNN
ncbi:hypothetical protein Trydic_g9456 [Trypoxylus dichotomus]